MSPASELPLPADVAQPTGFLHTLLTMSLTAVAVLRPLYDPTQTVIEDFAWVYLNAAGQRMLQQPERPGPSLLTLFPTAQADGVFAKCCIAYETGELQRNQTNYQADGLDGYFLLVAQRYDNVLVVNFTDTNDQPRTPVEQALRASQARERMALAEAERQQGTLQALLAQAPVAIALFQGPEVRVATVNEQMAALWGRTPAQVLGHPLVEGVPELRGQGFDDIIRAVQATGQPYVGREEPATILQNGQLVVRYYNYSCQLIYDAAGEPLGVVNVGAEVTEQVAARRHLEVLNHELEGRVRERAQQLAEQQQLLSQILSQVPAAVATLSGPAHRFSFFNEGYKLLTAGRAQLGLRVAEALPEVVEQGFIELLDHVYTSGEPFYGREIAIILQQAGQADTTQYLDFTYQPLTDKQGQTQGILVFAVDITAQVLARRQAATLQAAMLAVAQRQAQQRQELYQIFEQTPVAIVLLREPDHRIDYFNPAFRELFPPEQEYDSLQGHRVEEVYPRLKIAGLVRLLDEVFATGVSQTVLEMPLADLQPGSPRYITFAYQPYLEQDRIVGVAAFAYDATEQVLARQQVQRLNEQLAATNLELNTANTQLTHANADLDTFIYTASHDLRMPVANLEGLLAALRQELLDEPIIKRDVEFILGLMDNSIGRFQTTLRHLTGIIEQQAGSPTTQLLDLAALVEEVRLDLTPLLTETQGELLVDVQACPTLHSSPKDVRSILLNLLSNALKYRAPDRPARVQLLATCDEQWVELRVQDNGLGLSAAQQSQLFGLFVRLHDHVAGSGVGLYAIKRLIDNRGGTITVESTPGVGSTFRVRLPV